MEIEDIQEIIAKDEHRCLELKKTTGELQDGMHSACAFLNTEGCAYVAEDSRTTGDGLYATGNCPSFGRTLPCGGGEA